MDLYIFAILPACIYRYCFTSGPEVLFQGLRDEIRGLWWWWWLYFTV